MQAKRTTLANLRSKIDQIDDQILDFIGLRFKEVKKLQKLKKKMKLAVADRKREKQILSKAKNKYQKAIFKKILSQSRKIQKGL